jgi:predicted RecB family nuclease
MKRIGDSLELTASDLVGYLNCRHLSSLDGAVAAGALSKPKLWDPLLQILWERGLIHEQKYVEHMTNAGLEVVRIGGVDVTDEAIFETLDAMRKGSHAIVQGALSSRGWVGRADILRRVEVPSAIGDWSYEALDTKLARETRAGTVLQLCVYSDLLTQMQGVAPKYMYVIAPWADFGPQGYRYTDYAAYFRKVKRGLLKFLSEQSPQETYPDPIEHCDICRWRDNCDRRRRGDDHLCLIAGISKLQINELKQRGIATAQMLASMPLPLTWKPSRGSSDSYGRIREQARIQVKARDTGKARYELLPVEKGFGLSRLPEPSEGDIFFDLEGDPFVGDHGLEYLFGYLFTARPDHSGSYPECLK